MARQCPVCGLFNPHSAQRCDCGWDFVEGRVERSYATPDDPTIAAQLGMTLADVGSRNIKTGWRFLFTGIAGLTVVIALTARNPNAYLWYVLYASLANIGGGTALLIRGFSQRSKSEQRQIP